MIYSCASIFHSCTLFIFNPGKFHQVRFNTLQTPVKPPERHTNAQRSWGKLRFSPRRSLRNKNAGLNKMCQYLLGVLFVLLFRLHNLFQHFVCNNIYTYLTTCLTLPFTSQVVSLFLILISSAHCMGTFSIIIIVIICTIKVIMQVKMAVWKNQKQNRVHKQC